MKPLLFALVLLTACSAPATTPHIHNINKGVSGGLELTGPVTVDASATQKAIYDEGVAWPPTLESGVTEIPRASPPTAAGHFPISMIIDDSVGSGATRDDVEEAIRLINEIAGTGILQVADAGPVVVSLVDSLPPGIGGWTTGTDLDLSVRSTEALAIHFRTNKLGVALWFHEFMHVLSYTAADGSEHDSGVMIASPIQEFTVTARQVGYLQYLGSL